ncbi:MAG: hypothetical protein MUE71_03545 [Chitinophagaceae bacterium]|nr:hypothetical protein [Chitinophagaceae bacterium]
MALMFRIWILWCLMVSLVFGTGCRKEDNSGLPNMTMTLSSSDSKPMGGKVFRNITEELFEYSGIENNARPFSDWFRKFNADYYLDYQAAYILLTPYLSARKKEAENMRRFVDEGNHLLLITDGVSKEFKEVFGLDVKRKTDTMVATNLFGLTDTYKISADSTGSKYGFFYLPFIRSVDSVEATDIDTMSYNMTGLPDALTIYIGSGKLILVSNAAAFSNYFLLTKNNYEYAVKTLETLNYSPEYVFWDEFYRKNINRPDEDGSIFSAILSVPALRWAFWLLLIFCAIAVFTNMFRRQRVVPVRVPNRNTTVEFTQTIARLYFNKKDNSNIAQKMIQHFLEHIRSSYYVPHQKLDDEFAAILAGKTNQPVAKTERLVQRMAAIMNGAAVSDDMLLELNRELSSLQKPTATA